VIKLGVYTFAGCEGCQISVLSLGSRMFDLLEGAEFKTFRLLQRHERPVEKVDIAFIDGCVSRKSHVAVLKDIRKHSKYVIALGACAAFGGIPGLRKFIDVDEDTSLAGDMKRWGTIDVASIDNFIKVDYYLLGCPINPEEFYTLLKMYKETGKFPEVITQPVCIECRAKGNRCLLLDKTACLGPIVRGGCGALCPSKKASCEGCRGILPNVNLKGFMDYLRTMATEEEIKSMLFKYTRPSKMFDLFEEEKKQARKVIKRTTAKTAKKSKK